MKKSKLQKISYIMGYLLGLTIEAAIISIVIVGTIKILELMI